MKANTLTHITCLKTGDRFYIKSDPKKQVWELRYHTTSFHTGQPVRKSKCRNDYGTMKELNPNRVIVFLRSTAIPSPRRIYDSFYV